MFQEEVSEAPGPPGTFVNYYSEGERMYRCGDFKKALWHFDLALDVDDSKMMGYVARSKCYIQLGLPKKALQDAERTLKDDDKYYRGILRKAEALYAMGDFEFALVFFHRGQKLRPEVDEFRLGIQKSQEAIEDCVGNPSLKLQVKGDLSFFEEGDGKTKNNIKKGKAKTHKKITTKCSKAMLGELYNDKQYLENLLKDEDLIKGSHAGGNIYELVSEGIKYLDNRQDFWRQQRPMYAIQRDKQEMKKRWSSRPDKVPEPTAFILKNLEKIDALLASGKAEDALELANTTMDQVDEMNASLLPNKDDVIANLHSCMGNAYLEMGDVENALHNHQEDFEISKNLKFLDAKSRALDNLGRVHAKAGNYQQAIQCWEDKLGLSRSALESTWLYHEIGRCYLELDECQLAIDNGRNSLEEAKKAHDQIWQLNANVLIAQAQVKLEEYGDSIGSFRSALQLAKTLNDKQAETAITKALEDVNIKRSKQFRDIEDKKEKTMDNYPSSCGSLVESSLSES